MLPKADYAGSVSGAKPDKAAVFDYNLGEAAHMLRKEHLNGEVIGKCLSFKKHGKNRGICLCRK